MWLSSEQEIRVSSHPKRRIPSQFLALALLIVCLATLLRCWRLGAESVDGDELFSSRVAQADVPHAWRMIREDLVHPPLYYYLLKADVSVLGGSPDAIRTPSLIAGVATVAIVLLLGGLFPAMGYPALACAALLALNPTHIFYSQQARSYAWYSLLVALLLVWALSLEKNFRSTGFWVLGAAIMTALLWTHYVAAVFILAVLLAATTSRLPGRAKSGVAAIAVVAALTFLPWLTGELSVYRAKHGLGANLAWQGLPTWYDFRSSYAAFLGIPHLPAGTFAALVVSLGLIVSALWFNRRTPILTVFQIRTVLFAAMLPPCLLFLTTFRPLNAPFFDERHVLPAIVPFLLLVCLGLFQLIRRASAPRLAAFAAAVSGLALFPISERVAKPSPRREPYAVVADALRSQPNKPAAVYTTWPYGIGETVNYYLHTPSVRPLPTDHSAIPNSFDVLYRPGVMQEKAAFKRFEARIPHAEQSCRYFSAAGRDPFGTELCSFTLHDEQHARQSAEFRTTKSSS